MNESDLLRPPSATDKKSALEVKRERLESFRRDARDKMHDPDRLEETLAFLKGDRDERPRTGDKDSHYSFSHIWELLPVGEDDPWTFVDDRVLAVMSNGYWAEARYNRFTERDHDNGYFEDFCRWLKKAVPVEGARDVAGDAIARLKALGNNDDEHTWAKHLADEASAVLMHDDQSISSVGRFLLPLADEHFDIIVFEGITKNVFLWLHVHQPETLSDERVEAVVFEPKKEKKDKQHVPFGAVHELLGRDPARFTPLAEKAIPFTNCEECKMELARSLFEHVGDAHREKALKIAKKSLKHIGKGKANPDKRFVFRFARAGKSMWDDATDEFAEWALDNFGEEVAPEIEFLVEEAKVIQLGVVESAAKHLGQRALPMVAECLNMESKNDLSKHFRRTFAMLEQLDASSLEDKVWSLLGDDNESTRSATASHLAGRGPEVIAKATALLGDKKKEVRDGAARLLGQMKSGDARAALADRVDVEKNDDVRDLIADALFTTEGGARDLAEVRRRVEVAKARGKLKKPVAKWVELAKMPKVKWLNGDTLTDDELAFLLYRQHRKSAYEKDNEAALAYEHIDPATSGDFAAELLDCALAAGGGVAKNRFAYTVAGLLGDDRVVKPLVDEAVSRRRLPPVETLALVGSDEAARGLQLIDETYARKYRNVGGLAESKFSEMAIARGLTPYLLSDRLLKDLEFTAARRRPIDLGGEPWHLSVTPDFKVGFIKPDGKAQKSAPKSATKDDKELFKQLNKELKSMAKRQSAALETYLVGRRRWDEDEWRDQFAEHALMAAMSQRLLWGLFEGEACTKTFVVTDVRADDHGPSSVYVVATGEKSESRSSRSERGHSPGAESLLSVDGLELGLVHALDLDSDARDAASDLMRKQKIKPLFPQAERPIHRPADPSATRLFNFEGRTVTAGTFKNRAEKRGWRRGSVVDAGGVSGYRRTFGDDAEVFVMLEGMHVTMYDYDEEVTLREVFFVAPGAVSVGSYEYDEPRNDNDERLIRAGDVSAFAFSEAMADLEAITAKQE